MSCKFYAGTFSVLCKVSLIRLGGFFATLSLLRNDRIKKSTVYSPRLYNNVLRTRFFPSARGYFHDQGQLISLNESGCPLCFCALAYLFFAVPSPTTERGEGERRAWWNREKGCRFIREHALHAMGASTRCRGALWEGDVIDQSFFCPTKGLKCITPWGIELRFFPSCFAACASLRALQVRQEFSRIFQGQLEQILVFLFLSRWEIVREKWKIRRLDERVISLAIIRRDLRVWEWLVQFCTLRFVCWISENSRRDLLRARLCFVRIELKIHEP